MSDWDRKMASIDKKLESISDDQLVGRAKTPATAGDAGDLARVRAETSTFGVFARLLLSVALGVGIVFWPYGSRCGAGLAAYLGAVAVVIASGVWSAVYQSYLESKEIREVRTQGTTAKGKTSKAA